MYRTHKTDLKALIEGLTDFIVVFSDYRGISTFQETLPDADEAYTCVMEILKLLNETNLSNKMWKCLKHPSQLWIISLDSSHLTDIF